MGNLAKLLAVVLIMLVAIRACQTPGIAPSTPEDDALWMTAHGNDPKALDVKFSARAQSACAAGSDDFLRSIAAHDFEWDDSAKGLLGVRFDSFGTRSAGFGLLTLISDRAKLSNGFGAFSHIQFYCLYDAQSDKVVRYSQDDPSFVADEPVPTKTSKPIVINDPDQNEPTEAEIADISNIE